MNKSRAILPVLLIISMLFLCSCMSYTSFDDLIGSDSISTTYNYTPDVNVENTTAVIVENSTAVEVTYPQGELTTALPSVTPTEQVTLPPVTNAPENTTAPIISESTTAPVAPPLTDYSSFTKAQIVDTYKEYLNKTRAYTGNLTVQQTESFDAEIKEAHPGGALTELLASNIVKLVGSEGQQTLNFSGGRATNKDGENVPILLPQRAEFSLSPDGVAEASIKSEGDKIHIRIVLVPETVAMGEIPTHNASAIGYLDTSNMDFKIITISRVDITYPGSVIDAVIGSNGYIESVTYTINMSTYAELSGMGISGYGTLEGAQTEKHVLMW